MTLEKLINDTKEEFSLLPDSNLITEEFLQDKLTQAYNQGKEDRELFVGKPKELRNGQLIFNFLEYLRNKHNYTSVQSSRMGDPFHMTDKEFSRLLKEYLSLIKKD